MDDESLYSVTESGLIVRGTNVKLLTPPVFSGSILCLFKKLRRGGTTFVEGPALDYVLTRSKMGGPNLLDDWRTCGEYGRDRTHILFLGTLYADEQKKDIVSLEGDDHALLGYVSCGFWDSGKWREVLCPLSGRVKEYHRVAIL